jgi:uncharacterized membrane protein YeaQ/YmgE (transglycosylase-associated protein family)
VIGIVGSVVGPLSLCLVLEREHFNPISPLGFLAASAGALVLLIGYRLLAGMVFAQDRQDGR